jgi:hypothetical protein
MPIRPAYFRRRDSARPAQEFDAAFARIQNAGITFFADPACRQAGQIYRSHGRRGTYFRDPTATLMEILTPAA